MLYLTSEVVEINYKLKLGGIALVGELVNVLNNKPGKFLLRQYHRQKVVLVQTHFTLCEANLHLAYLDAIPVLLCVRTCRAQTQLFFTDAALS